MQLSRRLLLLTLLPAAGLLGACGFQLRGSGGTTEVPDDWKLMYLAAGNPNDEFVREITSLFAAHGIEWTERAAANYVLQLGPENFRQRNLSLSSDARIAEFELTLSTEFSVLDRAGDLVMPPTTARVFRQMENDPRNVVGKSEELRLQLGEMRIELANQVMRRIGFFATSDRSPDAAAP